MWLSSSAQFCSFAAETWDILGLCYKYVLMHPDDLHLASTVWVTLTAQCGLNVFFCFCFLLCCRFCSSSFWLWVVTSPFSTGWRLLLPFAALMMPSLSLAWKQSHGPMKVWGESGMKSYRWSTLDQRVYKGKEKIILIFLLRCIHFWRWFWLPFPSRSSSILHPKSRLWTRPLTAWS